MTDGAAAPLTYLQKIFGARLYAAAERLVDAGGVVDVRILQGGRVTTGITGSHPGAIDQTAKHRVYIQYRNTGGSADAATLKGECNCGEHGLCVHVAAVSIAAAKTLGKASEHGLGARAIEALPRPPLEPLTRSAAARQRLCYLLEASAVPPEFQRCGKLRLSLWVTHASAHTGTPDARAFALRIPERPGEYPRYVDALDREILGTLAAQLTDGPWELSGATGSALLRQTVATGRARWHSLQGQTLRPGPSRPGRFAWHSLPNGDQRLDCETPGSAAIVVDVEPALYIDTASSECGPLQLSCPSELLRQYWNRPAIAPDQIAAIRERIALDPQAAAFPTPRMITVQRERLSSLRARLLLSADADAKLQFVYNGMAVGDGSLPAEPWVRHLAGGTLHEIERDPKSEQKLRAQLEQVLIDTPQSREAWLAFMVTGVPALEAAGWEIRVDPGFPYRIAQPDAWYADLNTRRRREWFDLQLGVTVEGQPVNLLPALVGYLQAAAGTADAPVTFTAEHLFLALEDGRHLPVPMERIQRIAHTLVELFDRDSLNSHEALALPVSQAGRLAQLTLEAPTLRSDDASLLRLIEDIKADAGIVALPAPAHFPAPLRPYQEEGLGWLQFLRRHRLGGILADDMGLGKTVQTLAHLATEKAEGRMHKPSLIVAPVSVLGNWQHELGRFTPELKMLTLHGARRRELIASLESADVVITGYPVLLLDSETLLAREFYFVILDEAQTIKNPRAKVSQVARALRAEHRLCLTGTPMENHLGELWSLFDFAQPGLLGGEGEFQRHYRTPIEKGGNAGRARALSGRIAPFLLRRTKDGVARELPPKMQIVESIVLDEKQRDFYDGIRLAMHIRVRETIEAQGLARSHITVLDALLKLRQACCDPRLVNGETRTQAIPSAKLDWLSTALPEMIAEGRRILLFSQFTSMLRLIETALAALSIPHALLTGETQNRAAAIERFQSGAVPLFLISLKAGGTGLNLTAADTIIHYDPWWNPAAEAQATDRAHRIGQDKPVFVYKLIAQGTVEDKIMQLQADKHALASRLYAEQNGSPAAFSQQTLEALFAP